MTALKQNGVRTPFCYNQVGQLVKDKDRTYLWSANGKATQIEHSNGNKALFSYNAKREKIKRIDMGQRNRVTYYAPNYQRIEDDRSVTIHRYMINEHVMVEKTRECEHNKRSYTYRDQLGSVVAISDDTGEVSKVFHYDAWGKQKPSADWVRQNTYDSNYEGYTGHENIDGVGLVHMGDVLMPNMGSLLLILL